MKGKQNRPQRPGRKDSGQNADDDSTPKKRKTNTGTPRPRTPTPPDPSATSPHLKDDWSREFQQKGGPPAAQRRLLTLFPSGLAPWFPPVYIPCTWLVIKREEDVPRILKGIEEAVKDLVATTHA